VLSCRRTFGTQVACWSARPHPVRRKIAQAIGVTLMIMAGTLATHVAFGTQKFPRGSALLGAALGSTSARSILVKRSWPNPARRQSPTADKGRSVVTQPKAKPKSEQTRPTLEDREMSRVFECVRLFVVWGEAACLWRGETERAGRKRPAILSARSPRPATACRRDPSRCAPHARRYRCGRCVPAHQIERGPRADRPST
jgi:hypothetical protein